MKRALERLLLLVGLIIILAFAWTKPLENTATQQIDAGFKRALVCFAAARGLNAILSVVQGTEVDVKPFGVGMKFAPGQSLHAINELVAQFAELMLAASVAFGVMKLLITIGSYWVVSLLLSAFAMGWIWFRWRGQESPIWLARVLFLLLLVRFAIPLVTVGNDALFHKFLSDDYAASQGVISESAKQLEVLSPPILGDKNGKSIVERLKEWWSEKSDATGSRFEKLKQIAFHLPEHIINIIVAFLMQTLVVPLLLLWALYSAGKAVFDSPLRAIRNDLAFLKSGKPK